MSLPLDGRDEAGLQEGFTGSRARLSSNNPYRDITAEPPSPSPPRADNNNNNNRAFLTFAVRDTPRREPIPLRRSNTTTAHTGPVDPSKFEAAFGEPGPLVPDTSTPPPARRYSSFRRPSSSGSSAALLHPHASDVGNTAYEQDVDYPDTAGLTAQDEPRQMKRHTSLHTVATVLRRVSRRVINLHNSDAPNRPPSSIAPLMAPEPEDIPLTDAPTPIPSAQPLPLPAESEDPARRRYNAAKNELEKSPILLAGKSCYLFGPTHPLRVLLARVISWW